MGKTIQSIGLWPGGERTTGNDKNRFMSMADYFASYAGRFNSNETKIVHCRGWPGVRRPAVEFDSEN
jgi:hypothetical protein